MGIFNFDFGDAKKKIEDFIDDTKDSIRDILSEYVGENFLGSNIFGKGKMTRGEDKTRQAADSQVGSYGKGKFKELAEFYKDMWHKRYREIQQRHKTMVNVSRPSQHQVYKAFNQGKKAYHNNEAINYTQVTLWTGLLRETISDAFEAGGNEVLEMSHLLLTAGFQINLGEMPDGAGGTNFYKEVFTPWFKKHGIIDSLVDGNQPLFEIKNPSAVKDMMVDMFERGPVEDIKQLLNSLDAEI